jgi:DNA polymerase-4
LRDASQMADTIYRTARTLMDGAAAEAPFRLIGVGLSELVNEDAADLSGDLLDPGAVQRSSAERARDQIRAKFGDAAIRKGRALR